MYSAIIHAQPFSLTYTPTINNHQLINPDIGITDHQTIHRRDDPYWAEPTYPQTSVVYYRWYWEELEPEKGKYNYKLIDDTINAAKAKNKKIVIRFMTLAGLNETYYPPSPRKGKKILGIPCWLKKQLDPNTHKICKDDNSFVINYKNKVFKKNLKQFINAMGKRYDHNPNILRLDVGLVGSWGEWNLATHVKNIRPTLGANGYQDHDLTPYITMMQKAFPNKMLTMTIGTADENTTSYATKHGLGWRADCLGDWQPGWNHMFNGYPDTIKHIEGQGPLKNDLADKDFLNRWQHAPVDFEVCNDLEYWAQHSTIYTKNKVQRSFDTALKYHASLLNLKSSKIPVKYQSMVSNVINKLGYRFNLTHLKVTSNFTANNKITFISQWQNIGVAPSYNNYPIVWRLRSKNNQSNYFFDTKNDITHWLPATTMTAPAPTYTQKNTFRLPKKIQPGEYYLDVALVQPTTYTPKIQLGIDGKIKNDWYQLIKIKIKK